MRKISKLEPRTYVALARIPKGDGTYWEQGDEVPQAKSWRNPMSWVIAGKLGPIYDEPKVKAVAKEAPKPAAKPPDVTRPDPELSATVAAADQFEAEKSGEANPPPSKKVKGKGRKPK